MCSSDLGISIIVGLLLFVRGGIYTADFGNLNDRVKTIEGNTAANNKSVTDNITKLGSSSYRWTTVYASTGTINTSDATQKQQIVDLTQAEQAVAKAIKGLIKTFKFNDAVKTKGDDARIHVGVIAQDVQAAFEAEGLDPNRYGLFCSDVLEDGTVQLGIRYEELLAFVISVM